jgi:hypothetical protein
MESAITARVVLEIYISAIEELETQSRGLRI